MPLPAPLRAAMNQTSYSAQGNRKGCGHEAANLAGAQSSSPTALLDAP